MQTPRTKIIQALDLEPGTGPVRVKGWIRTVRDSKQMVFIELNDGSCMANLQVVADAQVPEVDTFRKLSTGSAIEVVGDVVSSPAKGQSVELKVTSFVIYGLADPSFPLQKKRHSFEYLREIAHLRVRSNTYGAIFRTRSRLSQVIHRFFAERGFWNLHAPIITASDCEGAGEMFRVTTLDLANVPKEKSGEVDYGQDFFSTKAYLTVSGQLNAEAFAMGLSEVYTFGPTFRAENSNTSRHASEFWMVEPEMAWADLEDNAALAEDFVKYCLQAALDECGSDLAFFNDRIDKGLIARLEAVVNSTFAYISYAQAVEKLQASGREFEFPVYFGANLQAEHERYLTETIVGSPTFVVDYPKEIKAFYMRRNDDDKTVAAMDLLVPKIGELVGGSQREERLDVLQQAISQLPEVSMEEYSWYLDTRRFGTCPHAGFGVGFERLLMYLTGMENIRDVIPFPRTPRNCCF